MADYFEIDFLDVESTKSGDAIAMRYSVAGRTYIHITDGGFQTTGENLKNHVNTYYGNPQKIDFVVVTHQDGDHAGGLRTILNDFSVGELWMLRPWLYADELLPRFARYKNVENLKSRLKEIYPNIAALEEIAEEKGIPIRAPFQGSNVGSFTVMAPTKNRYLDLVVNSDKTPTPSKTQSFAKSSMLFAALEAVTEKIRSLWGDENFSSEETSAENEMSIVQYGNIAGSKILLTGDTGRDGLNEAADYAPNIGLYLPGIDRFQVPHHGSRRNVSTEILDRWLGSRRSSQLASGAEIFTAIISAAKSDPDHPRKSVIRGMIHRGGRVITTEGKTICTSSNFAPARSGWTAVTPASYPEDQDD